jgi:hypothetical protein
LHFCIAYDKIEAEKERRRIVGEIMGRSTVIINGKVYDAASGLAVTEEIKSYVESPIKPPAPPQPVASPKQRGLTKQERLAAAIAREFDDQPVASFPSWISNFVSGNPPIEIEPIGLEKYRRDSRQQIVKDPANQAKLKLERQRQAAQSTRRQLQRSTTLNRHFVNKPAESSKVGRQSAISSPVPTHPLVHKFATYDVPVKHSAANSSTNQAAKQPAVTAGESPSEANQPFRPALTKQRQAKLEARRQTSNLGHETTDQAAKSRQLKDVLINEQLSASIDTADNQRQQKAASRLARQNIRVRRRFRAPTLITAALAVIMLGGYAAYVNMPAISVRVAANRAGVDAHNPYIPNGYSIDGPVAFSPGLVTINYKSNSGSDGYSFTQANTNWDDDAVRDNLVKPTTDNYDTLVAGDVTIYRFGDTATWVQNGILYTLDGNDYLGDDQILEIADSV